MTTSLPSLCLPGAPSFGADGSGRALFTFGAAALVLLFAGPAPAASSVPPAEPEATEDSAVRTGPTVVPLKDEAKAAGPDQAEAGPKGRKVRRGTEQATRSGRDARRLVPRPGRKGRRPGWKARRPGVGGRRTGAEQNGAERPAPAPAPAPSLAPSPARAGASPERVEVGVELPGERAFNQCSKLPRGKRVLKFNFKPDSEVADLVGWISSISCVQFLIPGPLLKDKRVTIYSPQLITPEEAYRLFLGAMESVGLTVEPMGKFLRIVETGRARFMDLPFYADGEALGEGSENDRRYITRLFRFQHLDAGDVLATLYNQLKGEQGMGVAYGDALIVTDRASLIARFEKIVREVDLPTLVRERIWMVRVRNTSATEMAARLSEIFHVQDGPRPARATPPRTPTPTPAAGGKNVQTVALRGGSLTSQLTINKLIPYERSNQLIVVANEQAYQWLLTILKKLDAPIEGGGDGRFHIYYCRHANCDELAATLSAVTGVNVVGASGRRKPASPAGPGAPPVAPPLPAGPKEGSETNMFEGEVRVTFDGATNSLVVHASLKDFQSLRRVIDKLDAPRKQVYVEAMIMEVLLDKTRDMGVAYHGGFPTSVGGKESLAIGGFDAGKTLNPAGLTADLVGLAGGLLGPALEASSSRIFGAQVDIPSFGVLVKMLQKNNDVNVLSNPHLLITNNQEGEISVGQRLPFPGGLFGGAPGLGGGAPGAGGVGGLGLFPQVSVNREDVSLRMKLVPSVNEHNLIKLDVDVEISDLAAANFNGLGPATSKRTAKTPVFCKDQQTVIIGGLMSDRATDTVQKVPFLGDIPILGFFFRSTSKQVQKSNIIIALTPYVISDMDDLRRVAEKKMRERREFMERFAALEPDADWEPEVDYRRTRGMLEEINRAARAIDEEELALRELRARDFADESTPIELPQAAEPLKEEKPVRENGESAPGAVDPVASFR